MYGRSTIFPVQQEEKKIQQCNRCKLIRIHIH